MYHENKILISAILIIGVALISSRVINTDISGRASQLCQPVSIDAVRNGIYIDVTINVPPEYTSTNYNGIEPAHKYVDYYRKNRERFGQQLIPRAEVEQNEINVQIIDLNNEITRVSVSDKCTGSKIFANII